MTNQPSPMRAQPETPFPRRSLLYVPGDSLRKIEKAAALDADTLILDLEDGVARSQKEAARAVVGEALARLDFGPRERLVRLNHPTHGMIEAELAATLPSPPHGYVLPKVEAASELLDLDARLAQAEQARGLAQGSLTIFAMIETARGLLRLGEIAASTLRLAGLIFGAEDFTADVGAIRSPGGVELLYARSSLVITAAAYGLHAVDAVYLELDNLAGLEEECALGRGLGFGGKTAIHPRQLPVINQAFTPAPAEVARAQALVNAFAAHQAQGTGVFVYEGKMVDQPVIVAAQRLLARMAQITPLAPTAPPPK
ncbi:MAG: CoA ester lyase [Caldilineaceae bacterium]|nr:CoA ester lyase [Caldilineaceae bacterium]